MLAFCLMGLSIALADGSERALIRDAGFADDAVGYAIFDLAADRVVRQHQGDRLFIPASMVKLATALAALDVLGPEHRFRTRVLSLPDVDGVHLHLAGGGDPVLVQENMQALADAVALALAGQRVARFTFDDAALPFIDQIDPSDDGLKPYNPPVSALSVNFNRQWLRWFREDESRAQRVGLHPDFGDAWAGLLGKPMADGRSIAVRDGVPTLYLLTPRVASQGHRQLAVRAPALRTAAMLRHYALQSGLPLPPPEAASASPAGAAVLADHGSRPLLAIAQDVLAYSNNLSAELIGLATARALRPGVRSLPEGAATIRAWLAEAVPEATAGWQVPNQSGLASSGRASPLVMLAVLRHAANRRYPLPAGMAAERDAVSPVPFLHLLRELPWTEGRGGIDVQSKSGTMFYARGQAGMLTARSGRRLLFVLMHTDFAARAAYEADPARYSEPVQIAARAWLDRARRLERDLLLYWAAVF